MSNKEILMDLVHNNEAIIPLIHDCLAEKGLTDAGYAAIFRLVYYSMAPSKEETVSFSKATKEWKVGDRTLSDIKLFCYLNNVCDIVRHYILSSWEACILSAWQPESKELMNAENQMGVMESLSHVRAMLKICAEAMPYSSDGAMDWVGDEPTSDKEE